MQVARSTSGWHSLSRTDQGSPSALIAVPAAIALSDKEESPLARRRLTVNLTDELVAALQDLADRHDTTVTEELRKAIQDRAYFVEKSAKAPRSSLNKTRMAMASMSALKLCSDN